jgi:glycosyltransferase involved in cell wall biosynthesis
MKILLTSIGHYTDQPSGSSRIAFDEARGLQALGHDTWVIAEGMSGKAECERMGGLNLLRFNPVRRAARPWSNRQAYRKSVMQVLSRHLPLVDVVHGHVPLSTEAAFAFYNGNTRKVYTVHSPSKLEMEIVWRQRGVFYRPVKPFALRGVNRIEHECVTKAECVTALSSYTVDLIRQCHGAEVASKVQLIPGWVDTHRFQPSQDRARLKGQMGWPLDSPVLFTVRRLAPRMGLDLLLRAAAQIHAEGLKFHIVVGGAGPLAGELKELSSKLGLTGTVQFLGSIPDEILPLAFAACDAFVLPTAALECFGLIAIEALASGRPVLATPVGAIPEIMRNYEAGWMARSTLPADIADLLSRFLRNKLPQHSPDELRRKTEELYSQEVVLDRLLSVVEGREAQC